MIGDLAAQLVHDNELLYVDSGTTCYEMRHLLKHKRGLTIILNSVRLAAELGVNADLNLIMIGGRYRPERMESVGPLAIEAIEQLRGYLAFIGADGLSKDFGLTASDIETANLYKHVMRNARETVLLADYSKMMSPSLFKIADIADISRVVTDKRPPEEWVEYFETSGIEMIYPNSEQEEPKDRVAVQSIHPIDGDAVKNK